MDTIAINADETINEEKSGKRKIKVSDTVKSATIASTTGMAVGATVKSAFDNNREDDTATADVAQDVVSSHQETVTDLEEVQDIIAEVDPNDIMLEEPVEELGTVVENQSLINEEEVYQPFANNDPIVESEIIHEIQPDEHLTTNDTESHDIIEEDTTIDMICGVPNTSAEDDMDDVNLVIYGNDISVDNETLTDELLAANCDNSATETDIQSDLMA